MLDREKLRFAFQLFGCPVLEVGNLKVMLGLSIDGFGCHWRKSQPLRADLLEEVLPWLKLGSERRLVVTHAPLERGGVREVCLQQRPKFCAHRSNKDLFLCVNLAFLTSSFERAHVQGARNHIVALCV